MEDYVVGLTGPVAVVCPTNDQIPDEILLQSFESMRVQVEPFADVTYVIPDTLESRYKFFLQGKASILLSPDSLINYQNIIFLLGMPTNVTLHVRRAAAIWVTDVNGRIESHARPSERYTSGSDHRHVFNFLSPAATLDHCFFPNGYIGQDSGLGPINSFGYRIGFDHHELAKRQKNHKVIACFGGSACWSVCCLHHQMFSSVMEHSLNQYCERQGIDIKFTVLNFGMRGNVINDEIMAYVTHCHMIRPDIVVSHDGSNEFGYGSVNDPVLLSKHSIFYWPNLESWAQKLHDTKGVKCNIDEFPHKNHNSPAVVVRAYVRRKRQFADLVTGLGGKFVWGLQPYLGCKPSLHHREKEYLGVAKKIPTHFGILSEAIEYSNGIYRMFIENFKPLPHETFIDFYSAFRIYGEAYHLLSDSVHLTPLGDLIVGEMYAQEIIRAALVEKRWAL
ncbi:MAG: hypothetical protein ABT940_05270 [Alphaproteobacteria bacterium]